jgi:prepilin-type N-terminal cleavage/methylation domain-containing protein
VRRNASHGFSLIELLTAMLILAEIATFTIPKVLSAQANSKYNAIGKEAMGMVSEAHTQYKYKNTLTASTSTTQIGQYFNYVYIDTVVLVNEETAAQNPCSSATITCYKLHNGAMLYTYHTSFGGTGSTNAVRYWVDPDGAVDGSGPLVTVKGMRILLYYNGMVRTGGTLIPATCDNGTCWGGPTSDPPWFSW